MNCSGDLKIFASSQPSGSNFNSLTRSLEQYFRTVDQNNFGNKIPYLEQGNLLRDIDNLFKFLIFSHIF